MDCWNGLAFFNEVSASAPKQEKKLIAGAR
jgi:hypothetical protein